MSLKINALNLNNNPAEAMNRNTLGLAKQLYTLPAFVPQFKDGRDAMMPRGAIQPSGEVMGQGTPTSDSIPAMVSNEEAILNAGAVMALKQLLGDDVIERLNQQHAPEGAETTVKSGVLHAAAGYDDPYDPTRAEPFNQRPANTVSGLKERLPAAGQNAAAQAANFRQPQPTAAEPQGLKARLPSAAQNLAGQTEALRGRLPGGTIGGNETLNAARSAFNTIDPYTGQPASNAFSNLKGAASNAYQSTKGALKNIVTDPVSLGLTADAVNQSLLNRNIQKGNLDLGTAARFLTSEGTRAPNQIAGAIAGFDPNQEGIASRYFGKAVEALTPTPELARAGRFPNQRPNTGTQQNTSSVAQQPPSLASGAINKETRGILDDSGDNYRFFADAKNQQLKAVPIGPSDPNIYGPDGRNIGSNPASSRIVDTINGQQPAAQGAIKKSSTWDTTGLRDDGAVQVLDWGESRFDNSGDPVQDAALQARRGAYAGLKRQAELMSQYDPDIARSLNPSAANIPQSLAQQAQEAQFGAQADQAKLAFEKELANRPAPAKYGVNDGIIYQQEGAGAEAFNQGAGQQKSGAQKAWLRFFDPNTTPEQQTEISKWLQENDSRSWLDYLKKQQ